MGLALVLQTHTGMRPGETLQIYPHHILFPEDAGATMAEQPVAIALGVRKGTKAKREQVARLFACDSDVAAVLRMCALATPPDQPMFPYSLDQYREAIKKLDNELGIAAGWGSHSPRAGFATDSINEGWRFEQVQECGRWLAASSLRIYLDAVGAAGVLVQARARGLGPALHWVSSHWVCYFPPSAW